MRIKISFIDALLTALASAPTRLAPHSGALEKPGNIFVHDERDARPREHAHEVRAQAAVEPRETLMRPRMRDRRRNRAVVRARERRISLHTTTSAHKVRVQGMGTTHLYARPDDLIWVGRDQRAELRRGGHNRIRRIRLFK